MNADRYIHWALKVDGATQAAAEVGKVDKAFQKTGTSAGNVNQKLTGVASGASALGATLSRVSPAIGGFASSIGTAGGAISGMTTAIGGPWGLVAGGLIAALGMAINYFKNYGDEQDKITAKTKEQARATYTLADALSKVQAAKAEQKKSFARAAGMLPSEEYEAEIDLYRKRLQNATTERERATMERAIANVQERLDQARQREGYEAESARIDAEAKRMGEMGMGVGPNVGGGRGGSRGAGFVFNRPGENIVGGGIDRTEAEILEEYQLRAIGKQRDAVAELAQAWDEENAAAMEALTDQEKEAKELERASKEAALALSGPVVNAFYDAAKGYKVTANKLIESIGDTLWASGWSHVLQAAAFAWIPDGVHQVAGAGLLKAGLAEMAGGLVLGAAGARMGGSQGAAPARPEPVTGRYTNDNGSGGTIVLNMHSLVPTREAAQVMIDTLNTHQQQTGRQVYS